MLRQALEVAFDCFSNIVGRFGARSSLGNTARQRRTRGYKHPVLVLFQEDTVLHQPAFYQSVGALPACEEQSSNGLIGGHRARNLAATATHQCLFVPKRRRGRRVGGRGLRFPRVISTIYDPRDGLERIVHRVTRRHRVSIIGAVAFGA